MIIWEALTPAQRTLMLKVQTKGEYLPYGGEWSTFYRLMKLGLLSYSQEHKGNEVSLTPTGSNLMGRSK